MNIVINLPLKWYNFIFILSGVLSDSETVPGCGGRGVSRIFGYV